MLNQWSNSHIPLVLSLIYGDPTSHHRLIHHLPGVVLTYDLLLLVPSFSEVIVVVGVGLDMNSMGTVEVKTTTLT